MAYRYREGLYGKPGKLRNSRASKKEHAAAMHIVKAMTKEQLVHHLAQRGAISVAFYQKKTQKELALIMVKYHVHAFNLSTNNYA